MRNFKKIHLTAADLTNENVLSAFEKKSLTGGWTRNLCSVKKNEDCKKYCG